MKTVFNIVLGLCAVVLIYICYFIVFSCFLCFVDDSNSFLFCHTVFQLLVIQFTFFVDERQLLVFNKVDQGIETCCIGYSIP